jgi:hypothetical protein
MSGLSAQESYQSGHRTPSFKDVVCTQKPQLIALFVSANYYYHYHYDDDDRQHALPSAPPAYRFCVSSCGSGSRCHEALQAREGKRRAPGTSHAIPPSPGLIAPRYFVKQLVISPKASYPRQSIRYVSLSPSFFAIHSPRIF